MPRPHEGVTAEAPPGPGEAAGERSLGLAAALLVAAFIAAACSLAIAYSDFFAQVEADASTVTEQAAETRGALAAVGGVIAFGLGALAVRAATGTRKGSLRSGALWLCGAAGTALLFSGHLLLAAVPLLVGGVVVLKGAAQRRAQ